MINVWASSPTEDSLRPSEGNVAKDKGKPCQDSIKQTVETLMINSSRSQRLQTVCNTGKISVPRIMLRYDHDPTTGTPMRQTYFEKAFVRLIGMYVTPTNLRHCNDALIDT